MLYGHDQGKNMIQLCDGESDVVCIAKGGTGADNAADARKNLGVKKCGEYDVLPIASGGTGTATAAAALKALGGAKFVKMWENASPTSDFNAQTVAVPGLSKYLLGAVLYYPIRGEDSRALAFFVPGYAGYLTVVTASTYGRRFISRSTDKDKVTFGQGRYNGTDGGAYEIPLEIYGFDF